jgi:hypothetical protein
MDGTQAVDHVFTLLTLVNYSYNTKDTKHEIEKILSDFGHSDELNE